MGKIIRIGPQKGPQERFLATSADICIYGGAAGGGKTFGLLLEPIRHMNNKNYNAVIFRSNYTQVTSPGGLWDSSGKIYSLVKGALWMQAGKTLGMLGPDGEISAHANGGAVGAGSSIIPEDSIQLAQVPEKADNTVWSIMGQAVSNESSKDASEGDGTTFTINNAQQNDGGGKVEVNVNMNPVIKIEGSNMDEEKIFQVLQNRIREMADDLGDEIAERMGKIFNNMPAVQEA